MAQINPKLKLKEKSSEEETLILIKAYFNNFPFTYSTREKINPKYWDFIDNHLTREKSIINFGKKEDKYFERKLNEKRAILNEYISETISAFNLLSMQKVSITPKILSEELDRRFNRAKPISTNTPSLNEFINQYITELEEGKRTTQQGQLYKESTIKNYKGFKVQFDDYQAEKHKKLSYNSITMDFYNDFVDFLNDKDYSINTIGRHIKQLKVIMRATLELGYHSNHEFERRKFRAHQVETDTIYLTETELTNIYKLDLHETPHLDNARDVFILGCRTAQRFSDYSRISEDNIQEKEGKRFITLIQEKTGERVYIPIHWQVDEILIKHKGVIPKIGEQKLNKYIKTVGRNAGIVQKINIEEIRGGKKILKKEDKCELIQSHTARRTGATNLYLAKIPAIDIMKITGHKTEREFLNYIKVTKEQVAVILHDHEYFQRPLKVVK